MPGNRSSHIALHLLIVGVCAGNGVPASAQEQEEVVPNANFLEYLASLEEVEGEWLGPEQMQYLQGGVHASFSDKPAPELLVTPEPAQLSPEQEEKK